MYNVLYIVVCPFVLYRVAIVLSVRPGFTAFDYPFDIFKLFFPGLHIMIAMQMKWSIMLFYFLNKVMKLISNIPVPM